MESVFKIEALGEELRTSRVDLDDFPDTRLVLKDGQADQYIGSSVVILRQFVTGGEFEAETAAFKQTGSKGILLFAADRRLVFCHCFSGGLRLCRVGGDGSEIGLGKERALLAIMPAGTYTLRFDEKKGTVFFFSISASYLRKMVRQYVSVKRLYSAISGRRGLLYAERLGKKTRRLIEGIRSAAREGRGDGFWLDARLWGFLHIVCSSGDPRFARAGARESVHQLKIYLDQVAEGPGRLPEVRQLAGYFHLHPKNLARVFKTEFGTTLRDYLLYLRMKAGYALLDAGRMSVNDVAYYLGYSNPFNFSRQFLNYFGVRPGEIKNRSLS